MAAMLALEHEDVHRLDELPIRRKGVAVSLERGQAAVERAVRDQLQRRQGPRPNARAP